MWMCLPKGKEAINTTNNNKTNNTPLNNFRQTAEFFLGIESIIFKFDSSLFASENGIIVVSVHKY